MKVYASISGGKDSLAALITHMERGGQCDGAIYCRIMFDDETSAEVPEHEEWLHSKRTLSSRPTFKSTVSLQYAQT